MRNVDTDGLAEAFAVVRLEDLEPVEDGSDAGQQGSSKWSVRSAPFETQQEARSDVHFARLAERGRLALCVLDVGAKVDAEAEHLGRGVGRRGEVDGAL